MPEAWTLPSYNIPSVAAPGGLPRQHRYVDNLLFQETQTKLSGRHIFRYGVETGELDTVRLQAGLNNETWMEAEAPEILLDQQVAHMAVAKR